MASVLIVEDQQGLRDLLTRLLRTAGYTVTAAARGVDALRLAINDSYDITLLDLILPDLPGEDILRAMLAMRPESRIIVLSSDTSIQRRIGVLEMGAADFLPKPFANAELMARVRLRLGQNGVRTGSASVSQQPPGEGTILPLASGDDVVEVSARVRLDLRNRQLVSGDGRVPLSPRECALLTYLVRRRGDVCSRADLLADVWGMDFDPGTNVLDVYINRLRTKMSHDRIETVKNVGYRLAAN